jgi:hypothetical protein
MGTCAPLPCALYKRVVCSPDIKSAMKKRPLNFNMIASCLYCSFAASAGMSSYIGQSEAGDYNSSFHDPNYSGGYLISFFFILSSAHWVLVKVVYTASDMKPVGKVKKDYVGPEYSARTYTSSPGFPRGLP